MLEQILIHIYKSMFGIFKNDILNILSIYENNKIFIQKYIYIFAFIIICLFKFFIMDYLLYLTILIYCICSNLINICLSLMFIFLLIYFIYDHKDYFILLRKSNNEDIRVA